MSMNWRFAKNAVANLGRGGAAALVAVLLPPFLVRHMPPASYAVWVLVLQTAAYVSYLNFGMQTAIGRYVALANEKKDFVLRDSVFSTAFAALCIAALAAFACLVITALAVPVIFPSVPTSLIPQMRWALLIVGSTLAIELPASAWNGVFIGLQRYELPAITVGGARIASSIGVITAAFSGCSLVTLAAIVATSNLCSYLVQFLLLRRTAPEIRFRPTLVRKSTARELLSYCFGLTVISFSMLLITGFDLLMVGRFEFAVVTPYSVAASMIALISGLLYAIINVILPHAAILHANGRAEEMGGLVISATRIGMTLLILTGVPILIYAGPILHLWIGPKYVASGAPLLSILIIANILRLIGGPYSIVLVAAGQQNYIKTAPLLEGFSNFGASIALGLLLGGIGVALGTFLGAIVGAAGLLFYAMPRTKPSIAFSRRHFLLSGVISPILWTFPLSVLAIASLCGIRIYNSIFALSTLLSIGGALLLLFRRGFKYSSSHQLISQDCR